jgi:hypothetical protein
LGVEEEQLKALPRHGLREKMENLEVDRRAAQAPIRLQQFRA